MRKTIIDHNSPNNLPRARKRFGQNFLVDKNCALKIVDLASLDPSDVVLEIGPGQGAITRLLADKGCKVFALEIDRDLARFLREEFRSINNVNIIEGDALKFDFANLIEEGGNKLKVIANLPYNVATPILFRLLEMRGCIDKMVLMFQKEVAQRIVSPPDCKSYGALSIFPQLYSDITIELTLPPSVFRPAPKIDSQVLLFQTLDRPRFEVADEKLLKGIISTAFSQRRKKLSNTLKSFFPEREKLEESFSSVSIDPSRRAETLSVEEFCKLSNIVSHLNTKC